MSELITDIKANTTLNRLANCKNPFQGNAKKVLCVCSAGLLRSPTAANVLSSPPFNFNTRSCGLTREFALIPIDAVLLHWCDEIVVMSPDQAKILREDLGIDKPIKCINIPDEYEFMSPDLISLISKNYVDENFIT